MDVFEDWPGSVLVAAQPFKGNVVLWPEAWKRLSASGYAHWQKMRSLPKNHVRVPNKAGLYLWVLVPRISDLERCRMILYVGEAGNLRTRFRQYMNEERSGKGRETVREMFANWDEYLHFWWLELPGKKRNWRRDREQELIQTVLPPFNTQVHGRVVSVKNLFY